MVLNQIIVTLGLIAALPSEYDGGTPIATKPTEPHSARTQSERAHELHRSALRTRRLTEFLAAVRQYELALNSGGLSVADDETSLFYLSELYLEIGDWPNAYRTHSEYLRRYPSGRYARDVSYRRILAADLWDRREAPPTEGDGLNARILSYGIHGSPARVPVDSAPSPSEMPLEAYRVLGAIESHVSKFSTHASAKGAVISQRQQGEESRLWQLAAWVVSSYGHTLLASEYLRRAGIACDRACASHPRTVLERIRTEGSTPDGGG